jgi:hypothetical protein
MRQLCILFLGIATLFAADAPSPVGDWNGVLKPGEVELRLKLNVQRDSDGKLKAVLYSLDQGAGGINSSGASLEGDKLKLDFSSIQGAYEAQISQDGKSLTGTWSQAGNSLPLTLTRGAPTEVVDEVSKTAAPLVGVWEGRLDTPGGQLNVRFTLRKDDQGQIIGAFDSIDQKAMGIPMSSISLKGSAFQFRLRAVAGAYDGVVDQKQTSIKGTWQQLGNETPLEWKRVK